MLLESNVDLTSQIEKLETEESQKFAKTPCHILLCNKGNKELLNKASSYLSKDGFKHCVNETTVSKEVLEIEATSTLGKAVQSIRLMMQRLQHALYRGQIYRKLDEGMFI